MPTASVLTAAYNAESYIGKTIESIINQSFEDFEFIIVDDASTDSTVDIINSYRDSRIKLILNKENQGLPKCLNLGLSEAKSEIIIRIDADDIAVVSRIKMQVDYLNNNKDKIIVGSYVKHFKNNCNNIKLSNISSMPTDSFVMLWQIMFGSIFYHPSVAYRRSVIWDQCGGYNPRYEIEEDKELWSRLNIQYGINSFGTIPEVLTFMRVHSDSITASKSSESNLRHILRACEIAQLNMKHILKVSYLPIAWFEPWMYVSNDLLPNSNKDLVLFCSELKKLYKRFIEIYKVDYSSRSLILKTICMMRFKSGIALLLAKNLIGFECLFISLKEMPLETISIITKELLKFARNRIYKFLFIK